MSHTLHYGDTPLPVGGPVTLNRNAEAYQLGMCDGDEYDEQYPDEPESAVVFESAEAAKAWLDAATKVLTPYIESGDRSPRVPDPDGWITQ